MPNNLKTTKINKQTETMSPFFELTKINEIKTNRKTKSNIKNRKTKIDCLGSVKYTIEIKLKKRKRTTIKVGRKFFLLSIICFRISLCIPCIMRFSTKVL